MFIKAVKGDLFLGEIGSPMLGEKRESVLLVGDALEALSAKIMRKRNVRLAALYELEEAEKKARDAEAVGLDALSVRNVLYETVFLVEVADAIENEVMDEDEMRMSEVRGGDARTDALQKKLFERQLERQRAYEAMQAKRVRVQAISEMADKDAKDAVSAVAKSKRRKKTISRLPLSWGEKCEVGYELDVHRRLLKGALESRPLAKGGGIYIYNKNDGRKKPEKKKPVVAPVGEVDCEDGGKYVGQLSEGKWHGQGRFTSAEGDTYEGEWREGKRHGSGTFTSFEGDSESGTWKEDKMHGQGTVVWATGDIYVGEFRYGKKCGQGSLTHGNGERYVGQYASDLKNGQGTYYWSDGSKYEGRFTDSKMNGVGLVTFGDGAVYAGSKVWNLVTPSEMHRKLADERER